LRRPTPPPPPPTSGSNAVKPNPNYIPPASVKKSCPYELPCGWCTKWDKKCDKKIGRGDNALKKQDPSLEYIKSGKGLPPLDTDKTEIPGIRLERIR
jgi:hypothetical protein